MSSFVGYLLLLAAPINALKVSSPSYVGAVVEYRPITEGRDGRQVAEQNAENFRKIIKKASEYNADIIVFPEIGLTSLPENRSWTIDEIRAHHYYAASYVPHPKDKVLLCDGSHGHSKVSRALRIVSCAARDYKVYVVVNHHEKLDCPRESPGCPGDGYLIYNTNVAFDREGRVVGRYRKYNLFSEPGVNVTAEPEISTFPTDFGVEFGQIICNDILYVRPALELVKAHNVTDLVFSAEWFSELPFLTSVQTHSAFAFANDVNLLSSGFNEPAITNGGSGIYLGREGISKATRPNIPVNSLIVSEVPKIINGRRRDIGRLIKPIVYEFSQDEIPAKWDETEQFMYKDNFSLYNTEIINPDSHGKDFHLICNRGLCCNFEIEATFDKKLSERKGVEYYRYRIGVFNGVRLFAGLFTVGIEVCGLFFCRNDTLASCGERYPADANVVMPTTFHSISIRRTNEWSSKKFHLPMTLTKNLLPVDVSKISYEIYDSEERQMLNMTLKEQENNLLSFAIYGRNLENDGLGLTKPLR